MAGISSFLTALIGLPQLSASSAAKGVCFRLDARGDFQEVAGAFGGCRARPFGLVNGLVGSALRHRCHDEHPKSRIPVKEKPPGDQRRRKAITL